MKQRNRKCCDYMKCHVMWSSCSSAINCWFIMMHADTYIYVYSKLIIMHAWLAEFMYVRVIVTVKPGYDSHALVNLF